MIGVVSFMLLSVVLTEVLLILLWKKEPPLPSPTRHPKISILVAARDEAHIIERCLRSLRALDYPPEKVQILVGDDGSTDNTCAVATRCLEGDKRGEVVSITKKVKGLKGKANVLAQLARRADGDYFFITDADMELPPTWVKAMLAGFEEGAALLAGVTLVEQGNMQAMDWLLGFGMAKVLDNMGRPCVAMGNNMAISREAYFNMGGYEAIPFSVTEDVELFKAVRRRGWKTKLLFHRDVLGKTLPVPTFGGLMQQRKRWMAGAVQVSQPVVWLLLIRTWYLPAIIVLSVIHWPLALAVLFAKVTAQSANIVLLRKSLGLHRYSIVTLILYEGYWSVITLSTLLFYLMPVRIRWKGRKY